MPVPHGNKLVHRQCHADTAEYFILTVSPFSVTVEAALIDLQRPEETQRYFRAGLLKMRYFFPRIFGVRKIFRFPCIGLMFDCGCM
jgi:hypothetical protein